MGRAPIHIHTRHLSGIINETQGLAAHASALCFTPRASKSSGVAGKGGAGAELAGLELSEGSELLVEEQGAVNKLIAMTEFSSLAEMEVSRSRVKTHSFSRGLNR